MGLPETIQIKITRQQPNCIPFMVADTDYKKELCQSIKRKIGMDSLPLIIFNQLVGHYLKNNKLREAMFVICMANWGTRFGDTVRVRFCHLFDENGNFKESFMLNGGEEKTDKINIYYNNIAIQKIVSMYLKENPREYYDYLFVSNSNNQSKATLRDIEIEEKFGGSINALEREIKTIAEQKSTLFKLFNKGVITENELSDELKSHRRNESILQDDLKEIKGRAESYVSNAPNIVIQTPMSRYAAETFIKQGLKGINIIAENRLDKNDDVNIAKKFNTHSLRKLFSDEFCSTGRLLKESGKLEIDMDMFKLLQDKLLHSKASITARYNQMLEKSFRTICLNMNIGLDVLEEYE